MEPKENEARETKTDDPIVDYIIETGWRFAKLIGAGSIQRCNCMIRQGLHDEQSPAIRRGKGRNAKFFTPEGDEILPVVSHEDMSSDVIMKRMKERGEVYIGHLFGPFQPPIETP
jgi:hypothetical protein